MGVSCTVTLPRKPNFLSRGPKTKYCTVLFYIAKVISRYERQKSIRQRSHNALKGNECHRVRRERSQKARQKAPPIAFHPIFNPNLPRRILPLGKTPLTIPQRPAHWVGHDSLLDYVSRIRSKPVHLSREATRPEIYRRSRQGGVRREILSEEVVGAPPKEEKRAEEDGGGETTVKTRDAMSAELGHSKPQSQGRGLL